MSNCDVAEKDSAAGQMSSARGKDDRVHLTQVSNHHHHHSASATAHGYAAPTIASQLRMKLGGLPFSSPCQRYRPVELFVPLCHKRDTRKTTTARPSYGKGLTKKTTSENDEPKSNDKTLKMHPPRKTCSSGNERHSKWQNQGFRQSHQGDGLKNMKSGNQKSPSTLSDSQLKDLNCDKEWNTHKVPQLVKANNLRQISAARGPDEKRKEVLRGIPPKLSQTKRAVEKKTENRGTLQLPISCNMKKDPLFEKMVEEEQHRWLAEVKKVEDERKEFYCINENLRINFKVEWISCNIDAVPIPTVSTSQDLQIRKNSFTKNLDVEDNTEKSIDKKINGDVVDSSGVIFETSIVEGVMGDASFVEEVAGDASIVEGVTGDASIVEGVTGDACRLSCEETSVGDADKWSYEEVLTGKAGNNGVRNIEEASVEGARTVDFRVNSQFDGHTDEISGEEILLPATELEKNCFDGKSMAEREPGWFDETYDKGDARGQKSSLSADICRLHDGNSSEFETSNGQLITGISQAGSRTAKFEVKYEMDKLCEEANRALCSGNKESLFEGPSVEAEIENAGNNMAREVSLLQEEANDFEADSKIFIPNMMSCYEVPSDAAERDNVKENYLEQSDGESKICAVEGALYASVRRGDHGMGDIHGRSIEEISLEKQKITDDVTGQMGLQRKEGEVNYVFELHSLENERRNLDSENLHTHSEVGFCESADSELPVHLIEELEHNVSGYNLTSAASLAKAEAGSDCLSPGHMSYNNNQSLRYMHKSSEKDVSFQESFQMENGEFRSCQEDAVMQRCHEEPHLNKSVPREVDDIRNEADLRLSFQRKSNGTEDQDSKGLHGLESNVCSIPDFDGRHLTEGSDKNSKQNLSSKENEKNVKKERAVNRHIAYDCTSDVEDDSGFNATVAVRDGASARHSTTVDVVCLDVGSSGHASVTPLITLISDSISA